MEYEKQHELLASVLDGMDALVTICNVENFEILFLNKAIIKNFNLQAGEYLGKPCYTVLQKRDSPCVSCPHFAILNNKDDFVRWEHAEVEGKILQKTAKLIKWSDTIQGHLEYAIDISELKQATENIRYLEKELDKIFYDPLTEIYSRRYFEENIERILQSLSRSTDGTLSLMMMDIDHFKLYNDTYGHIKGDDCLKAVAQTIRKSLGRKEDFVARFGGEEFVVVLPNVNEAGARYIAEKILDSVKDLKLVHEKSKTHDYVTISIGAVTGNTATCYLRNSYLESADALLYSAKNQGRNRYCFGKI